MRYYPAGKKCKLDSVWTGPYLVVAFLGWTVGIQKHPDVPVILIHCQDVKKWGAIVDRGPAAGGCPGGPYGGC